MAFNKNSIRFFFSIAVLAWSFLPAHAQNQQSSTDQASKSEKQNSAAHDSKPANETQELEKKIDKLQSLLEQQQRILFELQNRVMELEGKPRVAATTPAALIPIPAASGSVAKSESAALSSSINKEATGKEVLPASQPPAQTQDKAPIVAGWDKNHAFLRSADGRFETNISGYAQFDFRGYQAGTHPPNTLLIRRARLSVEGKLEKYFDYKLEGDFADTTNTILRDFYVRIHRIDELQFTFGQFKLPFSQEEIRSDTAQDFVERSLVNNLAPSRSPGLMASGTFNNGAFEYQAGVFNGKGLLANNNNGTPDTVLRLRFAPWINGQTFFTKGLSFGGAYSQGRNLVGASVRGQSESRSFTFFAPEIVNGKLNRANGELTWLLGPATIRAEYDQTNQGRANLGAGGTNLPGVVAKGYMAQFTYLLTGENKPDAAAVTPKRNLFDNENGKRGFGAWELKFRYANLQIADGTPRSNRADTIYFGTNWYLNRFVRYLLDFGFERFKDPLRLPRPGDRNFFVVLSRIQLAF
jgi:phosphate-selective porin OprO and OprP